MERLERILAVVGKRQDLVIVGFILAVAAVMIVPLPTWLMDIMIAVNITIGMLFLLLAVYLKSPLEFSTLPSAILIATLVRISITIATSRLILVQADAGEIITGFGNFVIAGNVVVGLVIFSIIAIAQFVVVTKGAERVAEVAARFALDALPGKQMSIDSDLRSGDIDRHEAKRRRINLERESQYYGAMDGAMKFVKGDAIVSMIVIFVNLIGGLVIGMLVHGMDAGSAFDKYALLTVGDGLSSQIPALLVAIAGGIVVTRVTTENSGNLGTDLARELVSSARSLAIVAAALAAMALVPGFPAVTFLGLAAIAGGGAFMIYMLEKRRDRATLDAADNDAAEKVKADKIMAPSQAAAGETLSLRVGPDLAMVCDMASYRRTLAVELARRGREIGMTLLTPALVSDATLGASAAQFDVDGAPAWRQDLRADRDFVPADAGTPMQADAETLSVLPGLGAGQWAPPGTAMPGSLDVSRVLAHVAAALAARWSARSFGLQEADAWLNALAQQNLAPLVQQTRQAVPLTRLAETCRNLLSEGITLSQPKLVLESLIDLAPKVEDNALLSDHLRLALARPISARHADADNAIPAVVVEFDLEDALRQGLREGPSGIRLSLDKTSADRLAAAIRMFENSRSGVEAAVLLTSFDVRRPLRQFLAARGIDMDVLAMEEIANGFTISPVSTLSASVLYGPHAVEAALAG